MIKLANEMDSFKSVFDRNGTKIHIGEHVLIINNGYFLKCQVCGFSNKYKYVYLINNKTLYKRTPDNIVIVHNLNKWEHKVKNY